MKTRNNEQNFNIGYKHNQDTFAFLPTAVNGHTTTRLNATLTQNRGVGIYKFAYGFSIRWNDYRK